MTYCRKSPGYPKQWNKVYYCTINNGDQNCKRKLCIDCCGTIEFACSVKSHNVRKVNTVICYQNYTSEIGKNKKGCTRTYLDYICKWRGSKEKTNKTTVHYKMDGGATFI